MNYLTRLLTFLLLAPPALSFVILPPTHQQAPLSATSSLDDDDNTLRLLSFSPTDQRWLPESHKLELKRQKQNFIDITDHQDLPLLLHATSLTGGGKPWVAPPLPPAPVFSKVIHPILKNLTTTTMHTNLNKLTSFHTRYYKSSTGRSSSEWLQGLIHETCPDLRITRFAHPWPQSSLIAAIPGRTNNTVIVSAHQDSINLFLPSLLGAPGADDDGSGTVTILEALRAICTSELYDVSKGIFENTIEFHWYSAEEGGLLGSQAVYSSYAREGRQVIAMLQQDMTGFTKRTIAAGLPPSVAVITDFVDPTLTDFIKKVVETYADIPWTESKCGYACSDHASAGRAGYRSAFVIESLFELSNQDIHTTEDKVERLDFDHMKEFAKVAVGVALELGMAKLE